MLSNPLFLINLAVQSGAHSWFIARFFGQGQSFGKLFLWVFIFFFAVLGPLDILIPPAIGVWRNLLNFALIFLLCWIIDRKQTAGHLVEGVVLWWIPMPISEVIGLMIIMLICGEIPGELVVYEEHIYTPLMFIFQLMAGGIIWFVYLIVLHLFGHKKQASAMDLIHAALFLSTGLLAYMCCVFWNWQVMNEYLRINHFGLPSIVLVIANVFLIAAVFIHTRRATVRQADMLIEKHYADELEGLLLSSDKETRMLRLRHDLINQLEQISS